MGLSANSLFHFTRTKNTLWAIFNENFRYAYCKESPIIGSSQTLFHIPMVCFCDIPLSQIRSHAKIYGQYGIGLTKTWGVENRLNQVLYVEKNSLLSESYRAALDFFIGEAQKNVRQIVSKQDHTYLTAIYSLADLFSYTKNYEGPLERNGEIVNENYRFSDEREWRKVLHEHNSERAVMPHRKHESAEGK